MNDNQWLEMDPEPEPGSWWQDILRPKMALAFGLVVVVISIGIIGTGGGELYACGPFPEPMQQPLADGPELTAPDGYVITSTDWYEVQALVLSSKRYRWDKGSDLAPVDFFLGWGPVTQEPYVSEVKFSQRGRWGYYRWEAGFAGNGKTLAQNTANTHIIPDLDQPELRDLLLSFDRGDVVKLKGYLVRVAGSNGYYWNSSRSRTDTGDGACEVFYVTEAELSY